MKEEWAPKASIVFVSVRDEAHQAAFSKALETLGVDWNKALHIPKFDSTKFPEVKRLLDAGTIVNNMPSA